MVLIKSPGHSVDSQMVFIRLQSGREILHSVDSAWILDNILQVKGKAAPWVKEDVPAIMGQLRWLKRVYDNEPNITILVTHDDALFERITRDGIVGDKLATMKKEERMMTSCNKIDRDRRRLDAGRDMPRRRRLMRRTIRTNPSPWWCRFPPAARATWSRAS